MQNPITDLAEINDLIPLIDEDFDIMAPSDCPWTAANDNNCEEWEE